METAGLLRELTEARGASGYEAEVRETVRRLLAPHAHDLRVDAMGNLIAMRRGEGETPRPSLMLAAHMDEIALMVSQLEKGFLRVASIGGFDSRVLCGQEVVVHGRREAAGVIVSVPPHFTDAAEREKPVPLEKLFVDIGLPPREVEETVRVGDIVTVRARWTPLASGYAANKAMDDRVGIAVLVLCLEELGRRRHWWDVYALATVQEEVTMAGAIAGAYGVEPTAAVALDVTFALQSGVSPAEGAKMDCGPTIGLGPNFHQAIVDRLIATAKAREIPHQVEAIPGLSGTDAWGIQVSRSGVPCGLLGIPLRSMHSAVETVCLRDVERTARLLAEFIAGIDLDFAGSLTQRDALAQITTSAPAATGERA